MGLTAPWKRSDEWGRLQPIEIDLPPGVFMNAIDAAIFELTNTSADQEETATLKEIATMLPLFSKERGSLIPILQEIQTRFSFLSAGAMRLVADHVGLSSSEVYGVASFYNQFRFTPPGRHQIKVCLGTACQVKGGDIILESFERKLSIQAGQTSADREFSIDKVACVGCCALAPVAQVDETIHGHVAPSKVEGLMLGFKLEKDREERERRRDEPDK
jgi:NADH-quinone oxidoreductase subunit E